MLASPSPSTRAPSLQPANLRRVIFAASLGTLFEWYDFYLYGSLAVFFGGLFFPKGNDTAQLLASLATFGAGFGVRPLGAVVFGYIGDRVGRRPLSADVGRAQGMSGRSSYVIYAQRSDHSPCWLHPPRMRHPSRRSGTGSTCGGGSR